MFETGRDYKIAFIDGEGECTSYFEVVGWEAPLLKVRQPSGETIFNTASPQFIRAEKVLRDDEKMAPPEIWITPVAGDGTRGEPFKA